MKICKFGLYGCIDVSELEEEEDMQPTKACTSALQLWHREGRGDAIYPKPVTVLQRAWIKLPEITFKLTILMKLNSKRNSSRLILQCHWHRFWLQEQVTKTELKLDLADFNQDLTEATSYLSPKPILKCFVI